MKLCPKNHPIVTIGKQDYCPVCEREEREKERQERDKEPRVCPECGQVVNKAKE